VPIPTSGIAALQPSQHQGPDKTGRSRTPLLRECELTTPTGRSVIYEAADQAIARRGSNPVGRGRLHRLC
jgi:hypothetical protein